MPNLNSNKGLTSLVTIILLILLVGVIWFSVSYFNKQPFSSELPRSLQQATAQPFETPKQTLTYTNTKFNFSFDGPSNWVVGEITAKNEKTLRSILQLTPSGFKGSVPPIKLLYADNPNKLSLQDLEKKVNSDLTTPILYSADDIYMLSGRGIAVNFRDKGNCVTTKCQIYTFSKDDKVYQLVSFPEANVFNQQEVFSLVMNTFKFADSPVKNTLGASSSAAPQP